MSAVSLEGRRIIITGGASGMGEALVRAFPALGARVVSLDLAADTGREIVQASGAVGFIAVDVSSEASVQAATERAVALLGGLDVLIHAAGIAPSSDSAGTNASGAEVYRRAAGPVGADHGGQRHRHVSDEPGGVPAYVGGGRRDPQLRFSGGCARTSRQGRLCGGQRRGRRLDPNHRSGMGPLWHQRECHRSRHLDPDV